MRHFSYLKFVIVYGQTRISGAGCVSFKIESSLHSYSLMPLSIGLCESDLNLYFHLVLYVAVSPKGSVT